MKKILFLSIPFFVLGLSGCAPKEYFSFADDPYHVEYGTEITEDVLKDNLLNADISDSEIEFSIDGRNEVTKKLSPNRRVYSNFKFGRV